MNQAKKNEIIAVILFAVGLFLFLSIFTFKREDLSFYTSSPNIVLQNVTGIAGSYIGGILLFFTGKASYVLPLLTLLWAASSLFQIESRRIYLRIFGTFILIVATSASLSMTSEMNPQLAFSRGGLIGSIISSFVLEYLGKAGATVFIITMIILSLLIATEFLILPMVIALYKSSIKLSSKTKVYLLENRRSIPKRDVGNQRWDLKTSKKELSKKFEGIRKQVEIVRGTSFADSSRVKVQPKASVDIEPKIVVASEKEKLSEEYKLPPLDLLKTPLRGNVKEREEDLKKRAALLENTLLEFDVEAKVVKINQGPVITMFELEPAVGTKVSKITSLTDNISLALKSQDIRIIAPLPGKGTIGIEVPNAKSELVLLKDVLETKEYLEEEAPLKLALGKDISGNAIIVDLAKMPHLLIAGATGSGKTVCLNGIVSSLLFNSYPSALKFLMIDPKRVELMMFEGIPHLLSPIVTNPKKAATALNWVVSEMERRYEIFAEKGTRNIEAYRQRRSKEEEELPFIIVIVDELADLMMVAQQDVEGAIMRIAQLSRAAGIHMILATQRPSVNVVTGVVKANFPARISFKVASKVDSRTVLDANGAEKLLGRGDMLLMSPSETSLTRGQCSLVEDADIRNIVKFVKSQRPPQYIDEVIELQEKRFTSGIQGEKDDLYKEAVRMVLETKQASASMLQRRLRVGYARAARMIDIMEEEGIVGPYNGSKPRDILVEDISILKEIKEVKKREDASA